VSARFGSVSRVRLLNTHSSCKEEFAVFVGCKLLSFCPGKMYVSSEKFSAEEREIKILISEHVLRGNSMTAVNEHAMEFGFY